MSRVSCIEHPARDPFAMLRTGYMEITDGNAAAAMLLSTFEHWTNSRLANTEERGGDRWIFRTLEELIEVDLVGAFGRDRVTKALAFLIEKKYVERRRNPEKGWDRTWQYRLEIVAVQKAVNGLDKQSRKTALALSDSSASNSGNPTSNTTDSVTDSLTPPSPPRGGRARDREEAQEEREAWAERHFPDANPRTVLFYADQLAARSKDDDVDSIRVEMERSGYLKAAA